MRERGWAYVEQVERELVDLKLSLQLASKLAEAMRRVAERQTRSGDVHTLAGGVLEVRVRAAERQIRLLFAYLDDGPPVALALHAFAKKTRKVDPRLIRLAAQRRDLWLRSHNND